MWGSNHQGQLGKKVSPDFNSSSTPILSSAFESAKPFKIQCGSYHNVCLSYRMPKMEETQTPDENHPPVKELFKKEEE